MFSGSPDYDGNLRDSEEVYPFDKSNFYEIIKHSLGINKYLNKYSGDKIINALLKTRELALAGNININFNELLKSQ
jgi:hypothetical protein